MAELELVERVLAHLMEIQLKLDEIHDEFNPEDFEELADWIINIDLATEAAINYCEKY